MREIGQMLGGTIDDACVPSASLVPDMRIELAEHPSSIDEPIKGMGEASIVGVPPAIVRALETATGNKVAENSDSTRGDS